MNCHFCIKMQYKKEVQYKKQVQHDIWIMLGFVNISFLKTLLLFSVNLLISNLKIQDEWFSNTYSRKCKPEYITSPLQYYEAIKEIFPILEATTPLHFLPSIYHYEVNHFAPNNSKDASRCNGTYVFVNPLDFTKRNSSNQHF